VNIEGVPVQFLPAYNALVEEALADFAARDEKILKKVVDIFKEKRIIPSSTKNGANPTTEGEKMNAAENQGKNIRQPRRGTGRPNGRQMKTRSISMPDHLWLRLDEVRGKLSRSAAIRRFLTDYGDNLMRKLQAERERRYAAWSP
jgi:hypothetical protein